MATILSRYGTVLRVYDNGGKTFDRYTILPPRWAKEYRQGAGELWEAIGASDSPYSPNGFGQHAAAHPGSHLGRRISWSALPPDVKRFARDSFPEYAPAESVTWRD